MFSENLFTELLKKPVAQAVQEICDTVIEFDSSKTNAERMANYESYIAAFEVFQKYASVHNLKLDFPGLSPHRLQNINRIVEFVDEVKTSLQKTIAEVSGKAQNYKNAHSLEALYFRDISVSDREKIQKKINEQRAIIVESQEFDGDEYKRLLKYLEKFQLALHNKYPSALKIFKDFF